MLFFFFNILKIHETRLEREPDGPDDLSTAGRSPEHRAGSFMHTDPQYMKWVSYVIKKKCRDP